MGGIQLNTQTFFLTKNSINDLCADDLCYVNLSSSYQGSSSSFDCLQYAKTESKRSKLDSGKVWELIVLGPVN